jgi:site-specific DNA recombinase
MKHEKKNKRKKKVAAYCRVSTLEQKKKGYGIDIQIRDATLFAERQGLLVDKFYKDEGESGIKDERRALRELLKDCKAGRVETIILPSLDRLSREVRIAENLFYQFKSLGVKILIVDMPQYNGERKDILIRQILEAIAEDNRREIIESLWKGRQERVRKGLFPGGNLPYGYARENKIVKIHQPEAEIVRRIYALAQKGYTGQAIADELNGCGDTRRNGKPWSQRQICRTLRNEKLYRQGLLHYGEISKENTSMIILGGC